jgi:hypothetical protein
MPSNKDFGKLYVTKPDLGSYIGGLGGIILSLILLNVNHFFAIVFYKDHIFLTPFLSKNS